MKKGTPTMKTIITLLVIATLSACSGGTDGFKSDIDYTITIDNASY